MERELDTDKALAAEGYYNSFQEAVCVNSYGVDQKLK
jgi:hypothetical protein